MTGEVTRTRDFLDRPAALVDGYLDVMGDDVVPQALGQRVMGSTLLPRIYERLWRPILFWGFTMRNPVDEGRQKLRLMSIKPGDVVLDVAWGPGNTTRTFVAEVGPEGLAIGVDSSATMLAHDAVDLPFGDATFDAVSCYGALYLMDDPTGALTEMIRVLKPGGRIALLTTCARGPAPVRQLGVAASKLAPLRLFDTDEVTDVLRAAGLVDVSQRITAASQTVAATRPI